MNQLVDEVRSALMVQHGLNSGRDAHAMSEVRAALAVGKHVTTYTDQLSLAGYRGSGYIIINPQTGGGILTNWFAEYFGGISFIEAIKLSYNNPFFMFGTMLKLLATVIIKTIILGIAWGIGTYIGSFISAVTCKDRK